MITLFGNKAMILPIVAAISAIAGALTTTNLGRLASLRQSCIIAVVASKIPQIWSNFQQKSTGQLSLITQTMQFLGALARVGTTLVEPGAFSYTGLTDHRIDEALSIVQCCSTI